MEPWIEPAAPAPPEEPGPSWDFDDLVLDDLIERTNLDSTSGEEDLFYKDPFMTEEQSKRDEQVTKLLTAYVDAYESKSKKNKDYRGVILWSCMIIVSLFTVVLVLLPFQVIGGGTGTEMGDVVSFATACVSFLALIVGLLHIVTKYVFPENDEEYITRIVELIQENDLKNKQENAKNSHTDSPKPKKEQTLYKLIPVKDGESSE